MADRGRTVTQGDSSRPPIFSENEWDQIVKKLSLSPRQAEVVGLVMQSKTDNEIAVAMKIGKSTVRKHLRASMTRLGADHRIGIAYRIFETFRQIVDVKDASVKSIKSRFAIAQPVQCQPK